LHNDSKIKYNFKGKCQFQDIWIKQTKPFYKINNAVDYSPVNGGLIVLNNLDSGNLTLTVYNHDGAHFNEVSSFNFYSKTMVFFDDLLYLVLIEAYYSFITDGTKCVTFKTQITGGRIKIPEEDFRN
jgi:hypothetical protein